MYYLCIIKKEIIRHINNLSKPLIMKEFTIKEQTINYVINYLATKPYNEVYQLIDLIQNDIKSSKDEDPNKPLDCEYL